MLILGLRAVVLLCSSHPIKKVTGRGLCPSSCRLWADWTKGKWLSLKPGTESATPGIPWIKEILKDSVWQKLLVTSGDEANRMWSELKVRVSVGVGEVSIGCMQHLFGPPAAVGPAGAGGWRGSGRLSLPSLGPCNTCRGIPDPNSNAHPLPADCCRCRLWFLAGGFVN